MLKRVIIILIGGGFASYCIIISVLTFFGKNPATLHLTKFFLFGYAAINAVLTPFGISGVIGGISRKKTLVRAFTTLQWWLATFILIGLNVFNIVLAKRGKEDFIRRCEINFAKGQPESDFLDRCTALADDAEQAAFIATCVEGGIMLFLGIVLLIVGMREYSNISLEEETKNLLAKANFNENVETGELSRSIPSKIPDSDNTNDIGSFNNIGTYAPDSRYVTNVKRQPSKVATVNVDLVRRPTNANINAAQNSGLRSPTNVNINAAQNSGLRSPTSVNINAAQNSGLRSPTNMNINAAQNLGLRSPTNMNMNAAQNSGLRNAPNSGLRRNPTAPTGRNPTDPAGRIQTNPNFAPLYRNPTISGNIPPNGLARYPPNAPTNRANVTRQPTIGNAYAPRNYVGAPQPTYPVVPPQRSLSTKPKQYVNPQSPPYATQAMVSPPPISKIKEYNNYVNDYNDYNDFNNDYNDFNNDYNNYNDYNNDYNNYKPTPYTQTTAPHLTRMGMK